jgi:hypothetical protein
MRSMPLTYLNTSQPATSAKTPVATAAARPIQSLEFAPRAAILLVTATRFTLVAQYKAVPSEPAFRPVAGRGSGTLATVV